MSANVRTLQSYVEEYGSVEAALNAFWDGKITDDPEFAWKFMSTQRGRSAVMWRVRQLGWTSLCDAAAAYISNDDTQPWLDGFTWSLIEEWAPECVIAAAARVLRDSVRHIKAAAIDD